MISSPSAYSPAQLPRERARAPQPGARRTWSSRATSPRRSTTAIAPLERDRDPDAKRDPAAGRELRRPLLHLLAAPAARRPLRRRRGVRRRACRSSRPSTSSSSARPRASSARPCAGSAPTASVVVLDNETANVLAMVGGPSYQDAPVQPRDQRPPPARLVVQAVHADHRARAGALARTRCSPRRRSRSRSGRRSTRRTARATKVVHELFKVNNYDDSYLGSASIATATTYSDNSVYSQLGTQVGPAERRRDRATRWGSRPTSSTKTEYSIADGPFEPYNPALILGGLEVGVTPLEMAHAYNTLAAGGNRLSGTMAAERRRPGRDHRRLRRRGRLRGRRVLPAGRPGARRDRRQRRQQDDRQAGDRPRRRLDGQVDPLDRGLQRHRPARPEPATRPGARPGPPTTTATPGSAARPPKITACVWVGYPDTVTPMETEYGGAPVDGGTFPALIFSRRRRRLRRDHGRPRRRRGRRGDDDRSTPRSPRRRPTPRARRAPESTAASTAPRRGRRARRRRGPGAGTGRARRAGRRRRRRRPAAHGRRRAPAAPAASAPASSPARPRRGSGRERNGLPAAQKRHGSSVAFVIPIRGPVAISGLAPLRRPRAELERRLGRARAPLRSRPIPSASVSLPGPEQSSRAARRGRAARRIALDARGSAPAPGSAPRPRSRRARRRRSACCGSRRRGRRRRGRAGRTASRCAAVSPT